MLMADNCHCFTFWKQDPAKPERDPTQRLSKVHSTQEQLRVQAGPAEVALPRLAVPSRKSGTHLHHKDHCQGNFVVGQPAGEAGFPSPLIMSLRVDASEEVLYDPGKPCQLCVDIPACIFALNVDNIHKHMAAYS